MQDAARLIVGILSFGAAIYFALNQYRIEYVVGFLLLSAFLLSNVQWFRAKAGDGEVELEAHFEKPAETKPSRQENDDAIGRLSERSKSGTGDESDSRDDNELESPAR